MHSLEKRCQTEDNKIDDLTDSMSAAVARTHFSEQVEKAMRKNKDNAAANLCRNIRLWLSAENDVGFPALEIMTMRLNLRSRLLDGVQFGNFPPPSSFVKGFSTQLWEALISNIDSKSQLYALCRQGTNNTQAFSSLIGETVLCWIDSSRFPRPWRCFLRRFLLVYGKDD